MSAPRIFAVLLGAVAIMGTAGCASMSVNVEILNREYWSAPEYIDSLALARIVSTMQNINDGRFAAGCEALKRSAAEAVQKRVESGDVAIQQASRYKQTLAYDIDKRFNEARTKFELAFSEIRKAVGESDPTKRAGHMRVAGTHFDSGAGVMAQVVDDLSKTLREAFSLQTDTPAPPPVKQAENQAQTIVDGLIGNAGLLDDPRASAIIYAPARYWGGQFNDTFCKGTFGNTDCAVKMEGLGSFTIKGVRLDATKITQATFSVAKEAIQTVAAVYGVPVPKSAPASGTAAVADTAQSAEIGSPVKRQRDASTSLQQLRLARLAILDAIAGQRQAIAGSDQAARDQAVSAITAVFKANRPQLDTPANP